MAQQIAGLQEGTYPNTFQTAIVMHPPSDNITQRFLDKEKTINHDFDAVSISTVDQTDAPNFNVYENENVFFPTPLPQPPPLSNFVRGPATDPCSVNIRPTPIRITKPNSVNPNPLVKDPLNDTNSVSSIRPFLHATKKQGIQVDEWVKTSAHCSMKEFSPQSSNHDGWAPSENVSVDDKITTAPQCNF